MPKNPIIEAIQSAGARNVRLIQDVEFLRTLEGSVARPGLIPDAKSIPLVMVSIRGLGERGIHDEPVPLARVVKSKLRASEPTFWDRIADDD